LNAGPEENENCEMLPSKLHYPQPFVMKFAINRGAHNRVKIKFACVDSKKQLLNEFRASIPRFDVIMILCSALSSTEFFDSLARVLCALGIMLLTVSPHSMTGSASESAPASVREASSCSAVVAVRL
jgi:hypothetical protein